MEKQCGDMANWQNLGLWLNSLQIGKQEIPLQLKEKLIEITKDASSNKERIKRVYQYLQATTRYVSIQLGIGGLQPIEAKSVAQTGQGDCKALSNYMKAMLSAIGIPSTYAIINTDKANIYTDFASLNQMNHAILMVPFQQDTMWLECTSQTMPFNYIHSNIAGHQSVLITPEGGKIYRLPKYHEITDNKSTSRLIEIDENGNGKATVSEIYKLEAYENMHRFMYEMNEEDQINYLAKRIQMPRVKISGLKINPKNDEDPSLTLKYNMVVEKIVNKSGTRIFIPYSSLSIISNGSLKSEKRNLDIAIGSGMLRADTLQFDIPQGYAAESIPVSTNIDSKFGKYSISTTLIENRLQIIQYFLLNKGYYPASDGEEFIAFLKKVEKEANQKAVFKSNKI